MTAFSREAREGIAKEATCEINLSYEKGPPIQNLGKCIPRRENYQVTDLVHLCSYNRTPETGSFIKDRG
jgi:hypothetical protein